MDNYCSGLDKIVPGTGKAFCFIVRAHWLWSTLKTFLYTSRRHNRSRWHRERWKRSDIKVAVEAGFSREPTEILWQEDYLMLYVGPFTSSDSSCCTLRQPSQRWGKKWDANANLNHSFYGTLINPAWEMSNVVPAAVNFAYQCNFWLNRCWRVAIRTITCLLTSKRFQSFCSKISANVLDFLSFPQLLITPYLAACVIALYFPLLNHA